MNRLTLEFPLSTFDEKSKTCYYEISKLGDICIYLTPLYPNTPIMKIFEYFMESENIPLTPIVDEKFNPLGCIYRRDFFEKVVLGRYGYGLALNSRKVAQDFINHNVYILSDDYTLESAAQLLAKKENLFLESAIIVTKNSYYKGVVLLKDLLYYLSLKTLRLAKESNPLTGLPGNWFIKAEIEKRLHLGQDFEVLFIDINDFKPYNDTYGFMLGDLVIKTLGDLLKEMSLDFEDSFIGHIGGDDFIVIVKDGDSESFSERLIKDFESKLDMFFKPGDLQRGFYEGKDRSGQSKTFPLLTLSIGIIPSKNFMSFAELASIASEVKAYTKKISKEKGKSVYFKDRRGQKGGVIHDVPTHPRDSQGTFGVPYRS